MSVRARAVSSSGQGRSRVFGCLRAVGAVGAISAFAAGGVGCTSESSSGTSSRPAPNASTHALNYTNGGFDTGGLASWTETSYTTTGIPAANFPPKTFTDLNLGTSSPDGDPPTNHTSAATGATPQSRVPSGLTGTPSLLYPYSGAASAAVNVAGNDHSANLLEQTFTVAASDVDPSDGLVHIRFVAAPVLQDATSAGHTGPQQPYFFVELANSTTTTSLSHTYNFANQTGVVWNPDAAEKTNLTYYTNWTAFDLAPTNGAIRVGDTIDTKLVGAGCYAQAHFGELYADAFSTSGFPAPIVEASAPSYANLGQNITYTVTAKNYPGGAATGVVVDFTLPYLVAAKTGTATPASTQTTLVSTTLPAGTTCTAPDTTGKLTCTLPSLSASASSSFQVTVKVPAAYPDAGTNTPYTVNEGTYDIKTTQFPTPLNGSVATTTVGGNTPVNLHASLTDGTLTIGSGTADSYTYTVTNNGATAVTGATLTDLQQAGFAITACSPTVTTNCGWTCTATGGGTCGAARSGNGVTSVTTTVSLPVGATATYTIYAKYTGAATTDSYTLTATPPTGSSQVTPFDNVASDTDYITATTAAFTATKTGNGDGLLTSNPGNVRCDVGCTTLSATYGVGETIAVWAVASLGDTFAGWTSGACNGTTTDPCVTTIAAGSAMTAKFVAPTAAATVTSTTNGTSTSLVRPGDTETANLVVTVPAGENAPLVITDTRSAGLSFGSVSAVATTGAPTCSGAGGCTPTVATSGGVDTWSFGVVTCANAAGCTFTIAETAKVATDATAVRGTTLTQTLAATGGSSSAATTTVVEPNLTVAHAASTTTAVAPGSTETISVTVANDTGGSNSDLFDTVVMDPFPAGTTAQNFQAGTCTGATASTLPATGAGTLTVTFPTATAFSDTAACTYTYDLVIGSTVTASALSVGADTATGLSTPNATYKTYAATDTPLALAVKYPVTHACGVNGDCLDGICDPANNECGYADGDGPCTTANEATTCQTGSCSADGTCKEAALCDGDTDCTVATEWCNTTSGHGKGTCTAKLANGTQVPTVANHAPALTGACTTASGAGSVGASVCTSGVCDPDDGKCGLPDGMLPGTLLCDADAECRAGVCVTATGQATSGRCEPCIDDTHTTCTGSTAACNPATNQCVACTAGNPGGCTGSTPVCDTTADTCAACNGNGGSGATHACPASAPICNTDPATGGSCSSTCNVDADCPTADWCNVGTCTAKLANGTALPTVGGHAPALTGSCTADAAKAVCQSTVCDGASNTCGYGLGDGPCAATTECTLGTCITSGTNATKCEACADDSMCGGSTPVCDPTTNACVAAAGCDGGACASQTCSVDSDCGSNDWCDAGACAVKLANGTSIPTVSGHNPALDGTCTTASGQAVCASGACDPTTNTCGYQVGDGPCTDDAQCVGGSCGQVGSSRICEGATGGIAPDQGVTVVGGGCSLPAGAGASDAGVLGLAVAAFASLGRRRRRKGERSAR